MTTLRLGTRGSDLALWQARHVASMIEQRLGCQTDIKIIKTKGDHIQNVAFHKMEGKGFFTKELQDALLDKRVDLVVHSLKDLPTESPQGLRIAAIPERSTSADLLLAKPGVLNGPGAFGLGPGKVLGTSSLRRAAQALSLNPGISITALRGNVPTRIGKLRDDLYDAILVAAAGVHRLELDLSDLDVRELSPDIMLPAPAQGALAIETRADDAETEILEKLDNPAVVRCVSAERGLLQLLGGGCHIPLGCLAEDNGSLRLRATFGRIDEEMSKTAMVHAEGSGKSPEEAAQNCFEGLKSAAPDLVAEALRED